MTIEPFGVIAADPQWDQIGRDTPRRRQGPRGDFALKCTIWLFVCQAVTPHPPTNSDANTWYSPPIVCCSVPAPHVEILSSFKSEPCGVGSVAKRSHCLPSHAAIQSHARLTGEQMPLREQSRSDSHAATVAGASSIISRMASWQSSHWQPVQPAASQPASCLLAGATRVATSTPGASLVAPHVVDTTCTAVVATSTICSIRDDYM